MLRGCGARGPGQQRSARGRAAGATRAGGCQRHGPPSKNSLLPARLPLGEAGHCHPDCPRPGYRPGRVCGGSVSFLAPWARLAVPLARRWAGPAAPCHGAGAAQSHLGAAGEACGRAGCTAGTVLPRVTSRPEPVPGRSPLAPAEGDHPSH